MIETRAFVSGPENKYRAATCLIPALILLPTLLYPFMLDQRTYQTMALQLIRMASHEGES